MRKAVALLLLFFTASCVIMAKPAFSSTDVADNTWVSKAPMHVARSNLGVAVVDGNIYAIGGLVGNGVVTVVNEVYDPETDTWSFRKPMPTARAYFATAVYQGKVYCIGGAGGANEVYDPATDTWENKTVMPTPRFALQANVVNGRIYLIGGVPDSSAGGFSSVTLNEAYDSLTDSWKTKTPMPHRTSSGASVTVDGKIYVIGGLGPEHPGESLNQIYDPETDTWSLGATPPSGIGYGVAGATVGVNAPKRIYSVYDGTQVYDPGNDSWTFGADLPTRREGFSVAVVDDTLYVIGGFKLSYPEVYSIDVVVTRYAANEQYTPFGYGTVPPKVQIVSPENMTYETSNVSLAFTVNKQVSWTGFSVDGGETVTITGNVTLGGLANDVHNVTVYAKDMFGNTGASETVSFTVDVPESFPTALVATASGASAALVGVGLVLYLKKRKR
jgi:N-acetylneuraminic acid mutarotase